MKRSSLILAAALGAILTSGASTASPIYMQYEGVQGDVTAAGHDKWIELNSVQWGVPLPAPPPAPAPAGVATGGPGTLRFVKKVDKASPLLSKAAASGKTVPAVQIDVPKGTAPGATPYLRYELKNVMITSYSVSAQGAGDPIPTESISFNFSRIEYKYAEQKATAKNPRAAAGAYTIPGNAAGNAAAPAGGAQRATSK
jgi:type VI secretion system secreted protein Hcp